MSLSGRKELTQSTNNDPRKSERLTSLNRTFSRVDFFASKGSGANTATVYLGFADTSALSGEEVGMPLPLSSGDPYTMYNVNLSDVFIAGTSDGDAVLYNAYD